MNVKCRGDAYMHGGCVDDMCETDMEHDNVRCLRKGATVQGVRGKKVMDETMEMARTKEA